MEDLKCKDLLWKSCWNGDELSPQPAPGKAGRSGERETGFFDWLMSEFFVLHCCYCCCRCSFICKPLYNHITPSFVDSGPLQTPPSVEAAIQRHC